MSLEYSDLSLADEDLAAMFSFLDAVREEGSINMFGARPLLAETFDLSRKCSSTVLSQWMQSFGRGDTSPEDRAAQFAAVKEDTNAQA